MREQIARWLHGSERAILKVAFPASAWNVPWEELLPIWQKVFYKEADEFVPLLKEGIRKVRSGNPYSADEDTDDFFAFDLACAKILKKMEGK